MPEPATNPGAPCLASETWASTAGQIPLEDHKTGYPIHGGWPLLSSLIGKGGLPSSTGPQSPNSGCPIFATASSLLRWAGCPIHVALSHDWASCEARPLSSNNLKSSGAPSFAALGRRVECNLSTPPPEAH